MSSPTAFLFEATIGNAASDAIRDEREGGTGASFALREEPSVVKMMRFFSSSLAHLSIADSITVFIL